MVKKLRVNAVPLTAQSSKIVPCPRVDECEMSSWRKFGARFWSGAGFGIPGFLLLIIASTAWEPAPIQGDPLYWVYNVVVIGALIVWIGGFVYGYNKKANLLSRCGMPSCPGTKKY